MTPQFQAALTEVGKAKDAHELAVTNHVTITAKLQKELNDANAPVIAAKQALQSAMVNLQKLANV